MNLWQVSRHLVVRKSKDVRMLVNNASRLVPRRRSVSNAERCEKFDEEGTFRERQTIAAFVVMGPNIFMFAIVSAPLGQQVRQRRSVLRGPGDRASLDMRPSAHGAIFTLLGAVLTGCESSGVEGLVHFGLIWATRDGQSRSRPGVIRDGIGTQFSCANGPSSGPKSTGGIL
ncbi:hypothetical protein OH77DRAFT_991230 [Trametes cingulata]|nr:hypothetical protein OH77DRAFT_991230 [Trametes cingulata]